MTNKKNEFLLQVGGIHIPALHFIEPGKIFFFPITIAAFKGASRASTRNKNIITHIGDFIEQAYIKLVPVDVYIVFFTKVAQNISQTSHTLVQLAFIEIKDGNF